VESWLTYLRQGLSRKLPEDQIAGQTGYAGIKASFKNLRRYINRHWRKGAVGLFLIFFTSLLSFPQPLITRYIIDDVILARQLGLLAWAIILLVAIVIAEKLIRLLEEYFFARFEQQVTLDIQQDLVERALQFPKSFFDETQIGYLMRRLSSDVEGLRWFFSSTIVHMASNALRFLGGVVFLFYLEWRLALVVLIILPGVFYFIRYFSTRIHILSHQSMEQEANVSSRLQESLSSASLIKAFATEARTLGRLMSELKKAFQISLERKTVSSLANLAISALPGLARAIVLALGAYWVIRDQWSLGSLLAFQAYLGYVFGPAQFLAAANLELQEAVAALQRVSTLFDIIPEENLGTGIKAERLKGEMEFKNVSFSYDAREPVLKNVSFSVRPGERVAIVGPSGVGKTTLLSLILRFYRPMAGEIFFDGRSASEYELGSLRQRIGYMSQSTRLVSGTIMENLRYGNPEASEERVFRATIGAGIHEFIEGLSEGYETRVGENGVNLSEGQRQRLAIARALIKDPDILVLDEPTSALDSRTELSIFQSLPSLIQDKTLFVVTSRLPTILDSDQILLLNDARIVDMGTHQSLLETNDYYRALVADQQVCLAERRIDGVLE